MNEVTDDVLEELLEQTDRDATAYLVEAVLNTLLDETEHRHAEACALHTETQQATREGSALSIQLAWRSYLAKRTRRHLREVAAAVHIQRVARGILARHEVVALKLQRDANLEGENPLAIVLRKRAGWDDHRRVTFVKAEDCAGVRQLTQLPGVDLSNAAVEVSSRRPGSSRRPSTADSAAGKLGAGVRRRLERCRGATSKLRSMETALSGEVGQMVEILTRRPPSYAYDPSAGSLRVEMRVGGAIVRSASKIESCNFAK
mmetsp:Transcript_46828/g.74928  ORF Transcript_46828/g.74928 Transcript_46828/m.74928 type:complete len:260 (+) Transcript_46828:187-966(+)